MHSDAALFFLGAAEGLESEAGLGIDLVGCCPALAGDALAEIVDEGKEVIEVDGATAIQVKFFGLSLCRLPEVVHKEKEVVEGDSAIAVEVAGERRWVDGDEFLRFRIGSYEIVIDRLDSANTPIVGFALF